MKTYLTIAALLLTSCAHGTSWVYQCEEALREEYVATCFEPFRNSSPGLQKHAVRACNERANRLSCFYTQEELWKSQ